MSDDFFAAVCGHGHVVNGYLRPGEAGDRFCGECGEPAHTVCSNDECRARVKGGHPFAGGKFRPKSYCLNCGRPYPWTVWKTEQLRQTIEDYASEYDVTGTELDDVRQFVDEVARGTVTEPRVRKNVRLISARFGEAGKTILDGLVDIGTTLTAKTLAEIIKVHTGT